MNFEKLYIYVAHHQNALNTAQAFNETLGQSILPEKGGITDPPRGRYTSERFKKALSGNRLYCFSGKLAGSIRANSFERFGVAILICQPDCKDDVDQFINTGTAFIDRLEPVYAHIKFKCKKHPKMHRMSGTNLQTVARVGLNGICIRTWLSDQISQQISTVLPQLGMVETYASGVKIDMLRNPFMQKAEDLIAANKKCRELLAEIGMLCDDRKSIYKLWKKAPNWEPFEPEARPNSYIVEHTIKGGEQSLPHLKSHVNALDAVFKVMGYKDDPRKILIQYEMAYLLTSDDVELRAAACVFYRLNYGFNYHELMTLVRNKMNLYDGVQNPWNNEQDLRALLATSLAINYKRGNLKLTQHVKAEAFRPGFGGRVIAGLIKHDPEFVVANALKIANNSPGTVRTMIEVFADLDYSPDKLLKQLNKNYRQEVNQILSSL